MVVTDAALATKAGVTAGDGHPLKEGARVKLPNVLSSVKK
jgi:hypothetical protein